MKASQILNKIKTLGEVRLLSHGANNTAKVYEDEIEEYEFKFSGVSVRGGAYLLRFTSPPGRFSMKEIVFLVKKDANLKRAAEALNMPSVFTEGISKRYNKHENGTFDLFWGEFVDGPNHRQRLGPEWAATSIYG